MTEEILNKETLDQYVNDAIELLKKLIATPRVSRDETKAADILEEAVRSYGLTPERIGNNIIIQAPSLQEKAGGESERILLLNAHIDTVKPVSTWTRDPFTPTIEGDRLYGLGSNDCGGGLVSLLQVFRILQGNDPCRYLTNNSDISSPSRVEMPERLGRGFIFLASCEEEVSGVNGIRAVLPHLQKIDLAIVGEPTGMQPAIAERGLMVIDGVAHGKSGHAARGEGVNAIYEALDDLQFIRDYKFKRVSPLLGETKMQCTIVNSGTQHNVVPDECRFTIDVRTNELYTNEEVFGFLKGKLKSDITARSFHLQSSSLFNNNEREDSSLFRSALPLCTAKNLHSSFKKLGMTPFGSPTLSDQALMRFPSLKLGPGESARSHSADEYICISEIRHAIETYLRVLSMI